MQVVLSATLSSLSPLQLGFERFHCINLNQSRISRTPYPPIGVAHAVTGGPKFQSRQHLAPQRKLRSRKLKYEALEISEVRGRFERKVHYSFFGPL